MTSVPFPVIVKVVLVTWTRVAWMALVSVAVHIGAVTYVPVKVMEQLVPRVH